jgi:hypothetical protein
VSDTDIGIDAFVDGAREAGQNDLAVAMRDIHEAIESSWPDEADVDGAMDDVVLPFHDDEREAAFALGLTFGAWLEDEYPDDELDGADDE